MLDGGRIIDALDGGSGTDVCLGGERDRSCEDGSLVPRDLPKYPATPVFLVGNPSHVASPSP